MVVPNSSADPNDLKVQQIFTEQEAYTQTPSSAQTEYDFELSLESPVHQLSPRDQSEMTLPKYIHVPVEESKTFYRDELDLFMPELGIIRSSMEFAEFLLD